MDEMEKNKIREPRESILTILLSIITIAVSFILFYFFFYYDFVAIPSFPVNIVTTSEKTKKITKNNAPVLSMSRGFRFLFFGDVMIDRHVKEKIAVNGFDYLLAALSQKDNKFFNGYDIISANLEGAVTNNGEHYPPVMAYDFAFAPELIAKFKDYNFNFFNLANNHFADQGEQGIRETRENLDKLHISYSGCQDKKLGDCSAKILHIAGKKVAFAGLSMVYGVFEQKEAENIITSLASSTDLVVVNIHWGVEYQHQFNKTQQTVAHQLIDAGADIIIGHHPHVVEGMEVYKGRPVFYSLGNFIFDQYFSVDTQEELAVGVSIVKNKEMIISFFPLYSHASQPRLMNRKEKEEFIKKFVSWSKIDEETATQLEKYQLKLIF